MELKKGYNNTEIGVIPEDWKVESIETVAYIVGGGTPSTSNPIFWNGSINWFTPTEIGLDKYVFYSNRRITEEGLKNCSARLLPEGTILLTSRAGIGDLAILRQKSSTNQGFQSLISKDNIDNEFLYYLMSVSKKKLLEKASGSTFLEISPNNLKSILIAVPPLPEQTAIATVLSDTDSLIQALEKKIAKKQLIKKGAMQKLLTPKEGWEVKPLGNFSFDISDGNYSSKYPNSSDFKVVGVAFIRANNLKKMTVIDDDMRFIGEELHLELAKGHLKKGDVLITTRGEIGQVAIVPDKHIGSNINAQIVRINTMGKLNILYFAYFLMKTETQAVFMNLQTGSALKQLPVGRLKQMLIDYPDTKEQARIAQILSDMDSEIESLQNKLDKNKQVKVGMMQNLLTGKIRLV